VGARSARSAPTWTGGRSVRAFKKGSVAAHASVGGTRSAGGRTRQRSVEHGKIGANVDRWPLGKCGFKQSVAANASVGGTGSAGGAPDRPVESTIRPDETIFLTKANAYPTTFRLAGTELSTRRAPLSA
jgi:hypothetical protein